MNILIDPAKKSKVKGKRPDVFIKHAENRIKQNQNLIIVVNGGTGTGKTYACIEMALNLSKKLGTHFTIDDNLDFSFDKLLMKMNLPINSKPGTVFILEEIGAFGSGGSFRQWQSLANIFFQTFLQTSRYRNQIVILNCPAFTFLDASSRILVHFRLEAEQIDYFKKESVFKIKKLQHNCGSGKLYSKYLRFRQEGVVHRYKRIRFGLPPKHIIDIYEKKKDQFSKELNKKILGNTNDKKKDISKVDNKNLVTDLVELGYNQNKIASRLGITQQAVSHHINKQNTNI